MSRELEQLLDLASAFEARFPVDQQRLAALSLAAIADSGSVSH
jgi:hypothetical protein